ncbi:MAG: SDR family NAD(P)-dependent oxidoreductase [Faecalibacterium prausnitzii]
MEQNVLNTDLTGKVAVVTGASGTLCSIFAKALARAGAKVALLGRNMEKLKALADEIEAEGGIARGYTCNVMNKANCLQVAEDVMAELGPCDILVNGAGGNNARANKILAATPMGRFGDSEKDLVGALLFLLNNDAAGFITGICLPIDGGFSAYSGV